MVVAIDRLCESGNEFYSLIKAGGLPGRRSDYHISSRRMFEVLTYLILQHFSVIGRGDHCVSCIGRKRMQIDLAQAASNAFPIPTLKVEIFLKFK